MAKKIPVFPREKALKAAALASTGRFADLQNYFQQTIDTAPATSDWKKAFIKFNQWLGDIQNQPLPYKIFQKGNSKLPFYAFSALPLVTCPGKGDCAKWCYSLKAWRYPAPFLRQVMNTILIKFHTDIIKSAFMVLPKGVDVRLYVDGDVHDVKTLKFWFDQLFIRDDLKAYGYSKSWDIFLDYDKLGYKFPVNYKLNLSSGSKFENFGNIRAAMKKLPIVRGEFIALEAGKHPTRFDVIRAAKNSNMAKFFVCPGKCSNCIKQGGKNTHACGSDRLNDIQIVIGTH
jgi:hypothetical protein